MQSKYLHELLAKRASKNITNGPTKKYKREIGFLLVDFFSIEWDDRPHGSYDAAIEQKCSRVSYKINCFPMHEKYYKVKIIEMELNKFKGN